ncbi:EscU/YscU/HrcU family type III secretion system export apparatus switch protein [Parasulfitobacter algicola]|uniref:EscU/YscU/HrcU family type III secretion system export apparatus switch protein n=1 Tax=Parasulfitobacter algicola TaxID=2614809 RepID=A0ABX2IZE2_9RHOB|nr:EscU/YscU/HrcU family type III secretion system export apparatus switch protein [Sulfitobacter algicola]NSX56755.1 EscU/YscU/HrcU family type III secretion system export apparatus switch protein [Sulfitobacter algicola]
MSSEEKTLPPSEKKLSDARKKGQIAHYNDLVTAIVFAGTLLFLFIQIYAIAVFLQNGIHDAVRSISEPFESAAITGIATGFGRVTGLLSPLFLIIFALTVLLNIALNKGFLFSTEAISPKLSNLDPVSGLKRIFGARALIELLKSLFKLLALGAVLIILMISISGSLIYIPACGFGCILQAAIGVAVTILVCALVVFLIVGAADVPFQKWLFEKDMKMSQTEAKQERKDSDGNPEIKSALRSLRMEEAGASGAKLGLTQATLLIIGTKIAIGLRYDPDDTPVPMFVAKAVDDMAIDLLRQAIDMDIPIHRDEFLATDLIKGASIGTHIKKRDFSKIARTIHLSMQQKK